MARFFSIYNPEGLPSITKEAYFNKIIEMYSSNITQNLRTIYFEAFQGKLAGFILIRECEKNRFYHDKDRQIIIISDGLPLIDDKIIDAKEVYHLYNKIGISKLASIMDGPHIELIIDEQDKSIHLIRDRVGLKPGYYCNKNSFICSSNAGAIIKAGLMVAQPNHKKIATYAVCNFKANYGGEDTFFNGISQIQPSTIISYKNKKLFKKKYWDWNSNSNYLNLSGKELLYYYKSSIQRALKNYHSAFDSEKIAVALSGGVDSGTIIGMLHNIANKKVEAMSLSYNEKTDFNETNLIQFSARDHAQNWTDLKLDPQVLFDDLQNLYNIFDIPFATISIYGYNYLYREIAKMGYKKIFTGAGGDYLQSGNYPCFFYYFADLKYANSPIYNYEVDCWIKNHSTEKFPKTIKTVENFFVDNIDFDNVGRLKQKELFLPSGNILDKDYYKNIGDLKSNIVDSYGSYQRTYIVQEILYEAVAPGVEAEDLIDWTYGTSMISPFFAKNLLDLGWELPPEKKIKNGINKFLAREALEGVCASEILKTIQKSGFNAPFDIWLRGPLNEFVMDIFYSKSFLERGLYNNKKFHSVLDNHMNSCEDNMMLLWQALNLELWMKSWID